MCDYIFTKFLVVFDILLDVLTLGAWSSEIGAERYHIKLKDR
jgi:hypothetical protein